MKRRQYLGSMAGIGAVSVLGTTAVAADSGTSSVGTIEDPSGDDNGPGSYTYPTTDQLPEGCFDVEGVDVADTGSHWKLTYHMGKVPNSFDADAGFSTQVFQLYVQDPNAPDDAPKSVQGRKGTTSRFLQAYHYRVHVTSGKQVLEQPASGDGDPNVLAKDFSASGDSDKNTVTISIPKEHFQTKDFSKLKTALLVFSQDGFGKGGIRQGFAKEAAKWKFGGVKDGAADNAPRVIDLVAPDAVVDQKQALSYSADSPATIPLTKAGTLINGKESGTGSGDSTTISDPKGDDYGPGSYTYPTTDQLPEGCFDVQGVDVADTDSHWKLTYHMGKVPNSFSSDAGFSTQVFQLYVQDPNAPDGAPTSVKGRKGMTSTFQQAYHYRVHVTSGKQVLEQPASGD
ncbi:MAG: glucodextranase DOMON-like domain-containing protein, partial [Halapricum sp.]